MYVSFSGTIYHFEIYVASYHDVSIRVERRRNVERLTIYHLARQAPTL
jgi:hypothetical protein